MLREQWKLVMSFVAGLIAIGAVFTALMAWLSGREAAFFFAGMFVGLGIAAVIFVAYVEPVTARLQNGLDGESNTADQLRRLRRKGWRAVHNIPLKNGDIDHVAIGPGGVVAIETKSSSAEWGFLERQGAVENWAQQAEQSAFRARHLVKQSRRYRRRTGRRRRHMGGRAARWAGSGRQIGRPGAWPALG